MRSAIWLRLILVLGLNLPDSGPAAAESGLPEITLGLPVGSVPQVASDLKVALMRRLMAAWDARFDPPSAGAIGPTRARLETAVEVADAEAMAGMGEFSRGRAEYLAASLLYRDTAKGWEAMRDAAVLAVAMERQFSASALFLGGFFPGTEFDAATGVQTTALQDVLFYLVDLAEFERSEGEPSPTRSEALAFWLAQAAFTGDTAMSSLSQIRRNPGFAEAETFERITGLRDEMAELAFIDRLFTQGFGFPDPAGTANSYQNGVERALRELQEISTSGLDVPDVLFPWMTPVSQVQLAIRPDEAVVMIVPAGAHVLLFAVTRDGFLLRRAAVDLPDLMDQADRIRAAVGWATGRSAAPLEGPEVKPTQADILRFEAFRAYQALLQPVEGLIRDKPRLLVVSTGWVGLGIPLELLLTAPAPAGAPDAELSWLVKRHAVTHVPALDLIVMRDLLYPRLNPARDGTWYLGMGDPDYALPSQLGRSNWATRMLASLRPLPDSAAEVAAVAASFGPERATVVTGGDASEALLWHLNAEGVLRKLSVLHLATHGLVHGDHPDVGEPLIALTPLLDVAELPGFEPGTVNLPQPDGALGAGEIRQLDLAARLVVLSACSSARVDGDTTGLPSLAAAFLDAGAERVLGTHWPIYSEAAVEIVTGMAARDPVFADPAAALRETLLAIIAEGGRKADPAYWAAFSLVGAP